MHETKVMILEALIDVEAGLDRQTLAVPVGVPLDVHPGQLCRADMIEQCDQPDGAQCYRITTAGQATLRAELARMEAEG